MPDIYRYKRLIEQKLSSRAGGNGSILASETSTRQSMLSRGSQCVPERDIGTAPCGQPR